MSIFDSNQTKLFEPNNFPFDYTLETHFSQLPSLIDAYTRLANFDLNSPIANFNSPLVTKLRKLIENEIDFQLEFAASGQSDGETARNDQ